MFMGVVMEFDGGSGKIIRSWQQPKEAGIVSEGHVHDGWMYLGSPFSKYAARIPYTTEQ
jgi:hypothetical protein